MTLDIEIISAGAGSGKTYTLTGRMVGMLQSGVRAGGILATTFTQKAAAELQERVRVRLLEAGMTEAANELGNALIGTVHSIGIRLLQRFAFEAGVSPLVEVIAEGDSQRLFNESLSQVLTEKRIETLNLLADQLGLTKKKLDETYDWRRQIRQITDVARANNFSRAVLKTSKKRSWESFERLLPPAQDTDPVVWNNRLVSGIDQTVAALEANEADSTKNTREAVETLRAMQNQLKWRGALYWHEWVKIAKTEVGAKSRDLMEDLRTLARSHDEHRQFRSDLKTFMDTMFDIAVDALDEFEQYKKKRGLIDYTDMETYVSSLLRVESVRETLREELDLLLVDEFQDTSPIQLDIFLQLSQLAKHSIWVGDPKQSIYGFRGAEPALMQAIVEATGGVKDHNILKVSWRSRADIVHAVNAIFTRAFPDLPVEQVALTPNFTKGKEIRVAPSLTPHSSALIHWHFRSELDERKVPGQPWLENCMADQIRVFLAQQTAVFNKKRDAVRPARPGDIAVLCRNNRDCERVAEALHRAGLKASIARSGLLDTPEAKLVLACLKYLLTASDSLSVAEILYLSDSMTLEEIVNDRLAWLHSGEPGETPTGAVERWAADHAYIRQLNALRPQTADLSASEILNLLLDELDLRRSAVRLGNPAQRLDNIDRLRFYALDYESACTRLHSAATLGGFLLWLTNLEQADADRQGSGESEDAVKVLTYHRSKGMEYPVVICHNLDQTLKEQVWGLNLVPETEKPDLNDILGKRWLRFWVNPYGDQYKKTRLEETLLQSPEWALARRQALEEEARLLYVGLTRARDRLVFPTTQHPTKWLNRVFNGGDESIPTLDPHSDETPFYWNGEVISIQTDLLYKPKDFPESLPDTAEIAFHSPRAGRAAPRPALLIDPYQEIPPGFNFKAGDPLVFAPWLEFGGDYTPALNNAVKTFFIADDPGLPRAERLETAKKQLEIRRVAGALTPARLLEQSDLFRKHLIRMLGLKMPIGKFPVEAWFGNRFLRIEPDLLEVQDRRILVFAFAPFAEGMKKWKNHTQALGPWLGWLRLALQKVYPDKICTCRVVFPIEGQMVEVLFNG